MEEVKKEDAKKFQIRGASVTEEKGKIVVKDAQKTEWIPVKKKLKILKKDELNQEVKETAQKEVSLDGDESII